MHWHIPKLGFFDILFIVFWLIGAVGKLRARWRLSQAKNWPLVTGSIESANSQLVAERGGATPVLRVSYSYQVDGEWYAGTGIVRFADEDQACEFTHEARGKKLDVNVNPSNPAESALTEQQLHTLSQPATAGRPFQAYALPLAMRALVQLLAIAAVVGAAFTLYVHLGSLVGVLPFPKDVVFGFFGVGFVLFLAALVLSLGLEISGARGQHAVPAWIRYPIYVLWVNAGFYLFLDLFLVTDKSPVIMVRILSSFALLGFAAIFTQLHAAVRARQPRVADAGIWREV